MREEFNPISVGIGTTDRDNIGGFSRNRLGKMSGYGRSMEV